MKISKLYITLGLMMAFVAFFELTAHADESNQEIKFTFSEPVAIPGQVLPAGTYTVKEINSVADPSVIQVYDADGMHLVATLQTVSAERLAPTDDTSITLAEPGAGPVAITKWFYPGNTIGYELIYPKHQERELALAKHETFDAGRSLTPAEVPGE
ncbi:MAG TPA: hypothetical protein VND65_17555 [Candidatus Binatia bacterium]|nr:hypothetical protein [Candidatus Binatia bacterium]